MEIRDIRGVNLGGWLVLERWITPTAFEGVRGNEEHSFVKELGVEEARLRLKKHWDTFIDEKDIQRVKKLGLNAVRLPIGYWLFKDQGGFLGGSFRYVDKLFAWAEKYDLSVVLCLHGVPGSQNGNDHSGRQGKIKWFSGYRAMRKTYRVLEEICERYGKNEVLLGVELVNEPKVSGWWRRWRLFRYYLKAGRIVENICHPRTHVIMSDAFQAERLIPKIVGLPLQRPVADTHMYQLFSPEDRSLSFQGHMNKARGWQWELSRFAQDVPVVVGEWSAAMDELYDPVLKAKARQYSQAQYIQYAAAQKRAFESAGCGWFYWTAKVEGGGPWSLLDHPDLIGK